MLLKFKQSARLQFCKRHKGGARRAAENDTDMRGVRIHTKRLLRFLQLSLRMQLLANCTLTRLVLLLYGRNRLIILCTYSFQKLGTKHSGLWRNGSEERNDQNGSYFATESRCETFS